MKHDPVLSAQLAEGATPESVERAKRPWLDHPDGTAFDARVRAVAHEVAVHGPGLDSVPVTETKIVTQLRETWNAAQDLGGSFPLDVTREALDAFEKDAQQRKQNRAIRESHAAAETRSHGYRPTTSRKSTSKRGPRRVVLEESSGRIITTKKGDTK